ncbi:hypothetical protein [Campylobacter concisus]|uniref:hypothetical protein n=1 Tax=Campylobacter concisus TaxID=199 RepID=UPI0021CCAAAC|nr:hypothetical protein [Campylobacter concisus]
MVRLSLIIQERVIAIREGAWYDPEVLGEKSLCNHSCVNILTLDKGASCIAQASADAGY